MIFALPFFASAMVFVFSCLSWLFFNVGVPVFGPIALLPLLSLSRVFRRASQGIAIKAIKDRQLLWVVISMCASACYEIGSALGDARTDGSLASILDRSLRLTRCITPRETTAKNRATEG